MVLANSDKIPSVPSYSGVQLLYYHHFAYGAITLYGLPFQSSLTMTQAKRVLDPTTPR